MLNTTTFQRFRSGIRHARREHGTADFQVCEEAARLGDAPTHTTHDHRLIQLVRDTGDSSIATGLGVPRSTAAGWLKRRDLEVFTAAGTTSKPEPRTPSSATGRSWETACEDGRGAEARIACIVLNPMTGRGRPKSVAIGA